MDEVITRGTVSVHAVDDLKISCSNDHQISDQKLEWGMPITQTFQSGEVVGAERLYGDSLTVVGSFDFTEFRLASFGKILQVIPIPALLINPSCSIVLANDSSADLRTNLGSIQGKCLLGLLVREIDCLKVGEAVSEIFDGSKSQVIEAFLNTKCETIWSRMHFQAVRFNDGKLVLVLIEDATAEKKLEIFSVRQEERLRRARDTLRRVLVRLAGLHTISVADKSNNNSLFK